jgi:adenylate cyclase
MALEIERKFLVTSDEFRTLAEPVPYRQGYLAVLPDKVIRVRVFGNSGFITVKGRFSDTTRSEFEYKIPQSDAISMLSDLCDKHQIEKNRFRIPFEGLIWEVDEFLGQNAGLVIAEIELTREDQPYIKPGWIGEEVTHDPRYRNANLARNPFKTWKK